MDIKKIFAREVLIISSLLVLGAVLYIVSERLPTLESYNCSIDKKVFNVIAAQGSVVDRRYPSFSMRIEVLTRLYPKQLMFSMDDIERVRKELKIDDLGKAACLGNTLKDFLFWSGAVCMFVLCPLYLIVAYFMFAHCKPDPVPVEDLSPDDDPFEDAPLDRSKL